MAYAELNDNVNEKMQERLQRMIENTDRSIIEEWSRNADPSNKENAI